MTEVLLFIKHGWQNIWKQKTIWLFSALSVIGRLILPAYDKGEQNLALLCSYLIISLLSILLSVVSLIGVRYLAFNFSIGKASTVQETLDAVIIFAGRIIGCSALGVVLLLPCLLLVAGIALNNSVPPAQISSTLILVFMPVSIFGCLWDFSSFGFFEHDWGIRRSIENAWTLFTSHFGTLLLLGILIIVLFRIFSAMTGVLTILLQSGPDISALSELNYIDPSKTLGKNMLFVFINGIYQIIFNTFSASVYALAYLKYSRARPLSRTELG